MHRLPGLDLLRAIAIVWVMLFHSFFVGGLGESFAWLQDNGWMGVDLFFVLSGYLIGVQWLKPLSEGRPPAFGRFYARRLMRTVPAYLAVLAIYFALPSAREAPGIQPLWQFLTYTVNFLIDYRQNQAFSHVWSLCVEEHFYLCFPLLAWWLARLGSARVFAAACLFLLAGGMALRGWLSLHMGDRPFVEVIYYPTWNRLDGLLAGVVLASVQTYRPALWAWLQAKAGVLLFAGLAMTGAAIAMFQDRVGLLATVAGYPLLSCGLALVVAAAASPACILSRPLPGAGWVALISYSLYLSHKLVFHAVQGWLAVHPQIHGVSAFAVYASCTLAGGALLHYTVEGPFLRLRDRLQGRRRPDASLAAASAGA